MYIKYCVERNPSENRICSFANFCEQDELGFLVFNLTVLPNNWSSSLNRHQTRCGTLQYGILIDYGKIKELPATQQH